MVYVGCFDDDTDAALIEGVGEVESGTDRLSIFSQSGRYVGMVTVSESSVPVGQSSPRAFVLIVKKKMGKRRRQVQVKIYTNALRTRNVTLADFQ